MKVLTKEEEDAHYSEVLRGGAIGGSIGLALGLAGVMVASRRYAAVRNLTLPFRAFLVSSSATAGAIIIAERNSIDFSRAHQPLYGYQDASQRVMNEVRAQETTSERMLTWARERRYTIVATSWAASIGLAMAIVGRNRFLTTSQKIVQARMYAQALTLAVLLATAMLEVADAKNSAGRWQVVKVIDPDDPEHKNIIEKRIHKEDYEGQDLWMDMVASEERRLARVKQQKEKEAAAAATADKVGAPATH